MSPSISSARRVTVVAAVGAIVLGGCGGDAGGGRGEGSPGSGTHDERLATERVQEFLSAMQGKEHARACAMMTPKLRRAITTELRIESVSGTCRTRAAGIYSPAKPPGNPDATVTQINVVRDEATATVTAPKPRNELATGPVESDVLLERRGNRWLIANF
jgi:hypothetical protein